LGRLPLLHASHRVSDSSGSGSAGVAQLGTETELDGGGAASRDNYTRFHAEMPTEGALTDAGLEVYPTGIYDLATQISREYNHPIIEITQSGCSYLDSPYAKQGGRVPDVRRIEFFRGYLKELARAIQDGANVRS
jgi:beta-glucosidase